MDAPFFLLFEEAYITYLQPHFDYFGMEDQAIIDLNQPASDRPYDDDDDEEMNETAGPHIPDKQDISWNTAYTKYQNAIIAGLEEWAKGRLSESWGSEQATLLKQIVIKTKQFLENGLPDFCPALTTSPPLLSFLFLEALAKSMENVKRGVLTVSNCSAIISSEFNSNG